MKKERMELEKKVILLLNDYNMNDTIKNNIAEKLKEFNISPAFTSSLFNNPANLCLLPLVKFCLFTVFFYRMIKNESINPTLFFNEEELRTAFAFKEVKQTKEDIVVFHNVDKTSNNSFVCTKETYINMSEYIGKNLVTYNLRTQRESTIIPFNDKIIEVPTIKTYAVQKITEKMLQKKFFANFISLNIRKIEGKEQQFEYDEKTRTLTILVDQENTFLDLIDGAHRCSAIVRVVQKDSEIDGYTGIQIFHFTEEEALAFIKQESYRTPINLTQLSAYEETNDIVICREIDKYGDLDSNEMFDKIARNYDEIKFKNKYVTFETLSLAIKHNLQYKGAKERDKMHKYLIKFFNILIGTLKEKYDTQILLKDTVALENPMFIGYIAMANELYKKENWEESLELIINQINFSEKNTIWKELGINKKIITKINSSVIKKISYYFTSLIYVAPELKKVKGGV